jgi:predicted HTH transcriptional regulator
VDGGRTAVRILGKLLHNATLDDLRTLVANQIPESPILEYKEALPTRSDGDRKEFLADVSAFANTSGGVIIYGIRELRDGRGRTTGLPEATVGGVESTGV